MKGLALAFASSIGFTASVLGVLWVARQLRESRLKRLRKQQQQHLAKLADLLAQHKVQEALALIENYVEQRDSSCFQSYMHYFILQTSRENTKYSRKEIAERMACCADTAEERDVVMLAATPSDKIDEFLANAVLRYPASTFWRMQQMYLYKQTDPNRVHEACDAILALESATMQECADAYLHKGVAFVNTQQYEQGLRFVSRAVNIFPNFVEARLTRAKIHLWLLPNEHAALADINHVLQKVDPQNSNAKYFLAYYYYSKIQESEKAAVLCREILDKEFSFESLILLISIYAVKYHTEEPVWKLFDEMKQKYATNGTYKAHEQQIEEIKLLPMIQFGQFDKVIDVVPDLALKNPTEAVNLMEMSTFATRLKQGFNDSFTPLKIFLSTADGPLSLRQSAAVQREVLLPLNALNQVEHEQLISCLLYLDTLAGKRDASEVPNVVRYIMNLFNDAKFADVRKVAVNGFVLHKLLTDPHWTNILERPDIISHVIRQAPRFEEVKALVAHMDLLEQERQQE